MPSEDDDTLTFELDSGRLSLAISALDQQHGETAYPTGWHALTTEARRRHDGATPLPIGIPRRAFNGLPTRVRGIMDVPVSTAMCPHCGHANRAPAKFLEIQSDIPLVMSCRSCEREFEVR